MSKRLGTVVALAAVLASQAGCYTTRVTSQARPAGPEQSDRQWFTLGGLVPLSAPAGRECEEGIAYTESKLSGTDWLINVGLGVAGGLVGYLACGNGPASSDPNVNASYLAAKGSCSTAGAGLVPFLIGSRTVNYACAGSAGRGGGQDFMPRPPPPPATNMPPAPPPSAP